MADMLSRTGWLAVAVFITSIAGMIGALPHWQDVTEPKVVSAALVNLGAFITALFSTRPHVPKKKAQRATVNPNRFIN